MDKAGSGALKFWAFQGDFVHDQFNRSVWRVGYHIFYLHKHRGGCDDFDIHNFLDFFLKSFGMFQEGCWVHAHCFKPINQRSYFQWLSTALPFSLKPMISAPNIHSVTALLSVVSLAVSVSAFPWIPVTGQQSTFWTSYFWISQKSPVISKAARCHKSSVEQKTTVLCRSKWLKVTE